MASKKTRVDFNAPESLVEQADIITDLLDISRTRLLIEALQDEIEDLTQDEQFQQQVKEAYYDRRVDFATVKSILGTEQAMRARLIRESLDRDPPEPQVENELPSQEEFYSEPISEWTPDESASELDSDDKEAEQ